MQRVIMFVCLFVYIILQHEFLYDCNIVTCESCNATTSQHCNTTELARFSLQGLLSSQSVMCSLDSH